MKEIEFEILEIKRRNRFIRFWSIDDWRVWFSKNSDRRNGSKYNGNYHCAPSHRPEI